MNHKKLLSLYGLKWNPFNPDLPSEALLVTPKVDHFCWRVEQMVTDGGFALITGETGTGKSVSLRILSDRLSGHRDVMVGVLERPQSMVTDFYRELGDVFGVKLSHSNRWGGYKMLREKWRAHIEGTYLRPVLLVDEAQEMIPQVLSELRLLSSAHFDTTSYLTVVLCGDSRLIGMFRQEDLIPLGSRIRTRLVMEYATKEELLEILDHGLEKAGNGSLLTSEVRETLVEHCAGNYRILMTMAGELLAAGMKKEAAHLDEKLYLEVFSPPSGRRREKKAVAPTTTRSRGR